MKTPVEEIDALNRFEQKVGKEMQDVMEYQEIPQEPDRVIDRPPEHIHSVDSVRKRFDLYSAHWSPQIQIDFRVLFSAIEELRGKK